MALGISRQRNQGAAFDTYFNPDMPYFVATPWQAQVRRESVPPFFRKRIGFQPIKVVPNRWSAPTGPGGVMLWGAGTGGGISIILLAVIALGVWWMWKKGGKKTMRKILRGGK